jgi:RHS repeat-associated protein
MRRLVGLVVAGVALALPVRASAQAEVVEYYGLDAIGSVRIVFDQTGAVTSRMDYGPFGEQMMVSTTVAKVYAGLFRDGEAGLDYAEARSYQVRTGRFSAPDPVYAGLFNPQAWNRYAYALNSPLAFVDPTGLAADSCVMKEFKLDGDKTTMAYDCSVTGGGGGPSWNLSLFSLSGGSFFGQGGSGSGRQGEQGGGRGSTPGSTTPSAPAPTPTSPQPTTDCQEFTSELVSTVAIGYSLGPVSWVNAQSVGASLMVTGAFDLARRPSATGFKDILVQNQDADVYRHIQFMAGATLTGRLGNPLGRLAANRLIASDMSQFQRDKIGAANELHGDYAGVRVGVELKNALFTRNFKELREKITTVLCK